MPCRCCLSLIKHLFTLLYYSFCRIKLTQSSFKQTASCTDGWIRFSFALSQLTNSHISAHQSTKHLHKTYSSCLSIILFKSWRPLFHHWHNIFSRSQCIYNIYKWLVKAQHSGKMDQLLSRGRSAGLLHVIQTESPAKGKLREAGGSFWNFCFEIIFTCCWLRLGWNCPPENPCGHKCWKALRNLENRKYDALIWKWQLAKTYWKQALEWR